MRSRTAPRAARAHVPRLALPALTHQRCAAGRRRCALLGPHAWCHLHAASRMGLCNSFDDRSRKSRSSKAPRRDQRALISEGAFASWLELGGRALGELYARGLN